jgi:ribonuclease HI
VFAIAVKRDKQAAMPWRWMRLRNQKVLARCAADGALIDEGGRVEIRYKPNDGRAYRAAIRNLAPIAGEILPDDHCGEAEAPAASTKGKGNGKTKPKKNAKVASGPAPTKPEDGEVLVYADGACSGNPGPAGLGVVRIEGDKRRDLSEFLGTGTNNIAELTAILRAAESMEDRSVPLRVYTDSTYAIGVLTKGWKAKANQELVQSVKNALAELEDVSLIHVRGHAGVELNEAADQLAVAAVQSRSSAGWRDV